MTHRKHGVPRGHTELAQTEDAIIASGDASLIAGLDQNLVIERRDIRRRVDLLDNLLQRFIDSLDLLHIESGVFQLLFLLVVELDALVGLGIVLGRFAAEIEFLIAAAPLVGINQAQDLLMFFVKNA